MNNIFVFDAAKIAVKSIISAASVYPKPGLITPLDNNALDGADFQRKLSACMALFPCFINCASIGAETAGTPVNLNNLDNINLINNMRSPLNPEDVMTFLRPAGQTGERDVLLESKGSVRLRGEIFLVGLLCAAAGRLTAQKLNLTQMALTLTASSFARGITERELWPLHTNIINQNVNINNKTPGERAYIKYGIEGVRGEAEHGYNLSLKSVGLLRNIHDTHGHLPFRYLAAHVLINIISENMDSCIAAHNGIDKMIYAQNSAKEVLILGGMLSPEGRDAVKKLDEDFRKQGISPRGSEVILSSALCIHEFIKS